VEGEFHPGASSRWRNIFYYQIGLYPWSAHFFFFFFSVKMSSASWGALARCRHGSRGGKVWSFGPLLERPSSPRPRPSRHLHRVLAIDLHRSADGRVGRRAGGHESRWLCKPTIWVMLCKTIKYEVIVSTGMSRAARPAHELRSARGTAAQNPKISENLDDTHFETL
jgi:hypothetical protein